MPAPTATHPAPNAARGDRIPAPFAPLEPLTGKPRFSDHLVAPVRLLHRAARYRWKLNRGEIRAMLERLPVGGVAIDVGAHKGGYAYWMARAVGPNGRVFAFEPQERVAQPTAAHFRAAGLARVEYFHAAVSDRAGLATLSFWGGSTHGASIDPLSGPDLHAATVRTTSIDEFALHQELDRIDFLKIDVEGHEMAVLRGALNALAFFKPRILVECESRLHEKGADPLGDVRGVLEPLGYRGFFFRRADRLPIEKFRPDEHQQYGKGFYSNNFFFTTR